MIVAFKRRQTYIDDVLGRWGSWQAGQNRSGLGHALSKYDGVPGGARSSDDVPNIERDVLEIDGRIKHLPDEYYAVVRERYVMPGSNADKARRLGISKSRFDETLTHAKNMLEHWMARKPSPEQFSGSSATN